MVPKAFLVGQQLPPVQSRLYQSLLFVLPWYTRTAVGLAQGIKSFFRRTAAPISPKQAEAVFTTSWTCLDDPTSLHLDRVATATAQLAPGALTDYSGKQQPVLI